MENNIEFIAEIAIIINTTVQTIWFTLYLLTRKDNEKH